MSMIYEPKGRAREYAPLACNVYRGCDHRCTYCYAPSAIRSTQSDFAKPKERNGFLDNLQKELVKNPGNRERVLLSFTCDPYQRFDVNHQITRRTIQLLHKHGYKIQVLTKGGSRALRDLDLFGEGDAFASTLTLLDSFESIEWEPGAALPQDRIDTIRKFREAGIETWVSLEPVLDPGAALEIIRLTHEFVDLYKVGKLNYHPLAKTIDWAKFASDVVALLESLGKSYYIKKDLQAYLSNIPA